MKQIPLLQGKALLVELPEGAPKLYVINTGQPHLSYLDIDVDLPEVDLPPGNWRIIGMLSEVTEGRAEQLVGFGDADPSGDLFVAGHRLFDKEQEEPFLFWRDVTALEALESAIEAEGYWFDNPHPMPTYEPKTRQAHIAKIEEIALHKETQSRVLDRSRCLLLGRVE